MAVLQPVVITLVELSTLCILTLPYIFPRVESFIVINFMENLEKDLINPKNGKNFWHNITREDEVPLKKIRNCDKQTIIIQNKWSRFVILDDSDCE